VVGDLDRHHQLLITAPNAVPASTPGPVQRDADLHVDDRR